MIFAPLESLIYILSNGMSNLICLVKLSIYMSIDSYLIGSSVARLDRSVEEATPDCRTLAASKMDPARKATRACPNKYRHLGEIHLAFAYNY